MSSSWHENRYRISVNNVNLNEPQEIPLESFQDQSEWTTHFYQHQEDAQLGSGNGCVIAAVLNRQVPAGSVVPSMQLMESSTVSFSDSGMEPRSTSQAREDGQEMTMDRKQKRIMKNRESAARSRARKLAYKNELENKVVCLEEELKILKEQKEKEAAKYLLKQDSKGIPIRRVNSGPY